MLTRLNIRNFKKLQHVDIELGRNVVFIGPNSSGKTSALQALSLWDIGLRVWHEKRSGRPSPEKRPGVTINRRDLMSIPVPAANLLWRDLHVRNVTRASGRQQTSNILIEILVEGIHEDRTWQGGLEFDYANEESFYCRPLRTEDGTESKRTEIPQEALKMRVSYLPPMSGLASVEPRVDPGRINVLLGEGQTAQVLRNLCFQIYDRDQREWDSLVDRIYSLFGAKLLPPDWIQERGEITMAYQEPGRAKLDLSASGRGMQQTLLLLAHLYANPKTVLLLDEPDAHLEILRQRQIYQIITELAQQKESQIIAASHSEVVLNEAADRDIVIAFVGKPHRIDDRRQAQVRKSLRDIGFDHYYLAEEKGWVLYLEGSTDLAILRKLAEKIGHAAANDLRMPFVHYVANQPQKARDHFAGLREAKTDLLGIGLFDRLDRQPPAESLIQEMMWVKREIENYICTEQVLISYARHDQPTDDMFGALEADRRENLMRESIQEVTKALQILKKPSPWSDDLKVSDDFLDPLFESYFEKVGLPNLLRKSDYHILADFMSAEGIGSEVVEKLDAIHAIAIHASPRQN
jgi:hypothetical protein